MLGSNICYIEQYNSIVAVSVKQCICLALSTGFDDLSTSWAPFQENVMMYFMEKSLSADDPSMFVIEEIRRKISKAKPLTSFFYALVLNCVAILRVAK
jgi:hypothetical protein